MDFLMDTDLIMDIIRFGILYIPTLLVFFIILGVYKKNGVSIKWKLHLVYITIFLAYIVGVAHFTGIGLIYEAMRLGKIEGGFNLIPFKHGFNKIGMTLNIIMCVPLGILVPFIWRRNDNIFKVGVIGFIFSLLIEISQLYSYRSSDIDDLIANTLGAVIGYIIYKVIAIVFRFKKKDNYYVFEPMLYIIVIFIAQYLLYNEFKIASILYGW